MLVVATVAFRADRASSRQLDEAEEKRKQEVAEAVTLIHRFVRRFCHVKMAVDAFLKPPPLEAPKSPVSDGRAIGRLRPASGR